MIQRSGGLAASGSRSVSQQRVIVVDDDDDTRDVAAAEEPDLEPDTRVEVQSLYDGHWAGGFVVERADDVGYWLARTDHSPLPAPIRRGRVRPRASD